MAKSKKKRSLADRVAAPLIPPPIRAMTGNRTGLALILTVASAVLGGGIGTVTGHLHWDSGVPRLRERLKQTDAARKGVAASEARIPGPPGRAAPPGGQGIAAQAAGGDRVWGRPLPGPVAIRAGGDPTARTAQAGATSTGWSGAGNSPAAGSTNPYGAPPSAGGTTYPAATGYGGQPPSAYGTVPGSGYAGQPPAAYGSPPGATYGIPASVGNGSPPGSAYGRPLPADYGAAPGMTYGGPPPAGAASPANTASTNPQPPAFNGSSGYGTAAGPPPGSVAPPGGTASPPPGTPWYQAPPAQPTQPPPTRGLRRFTDKLNPFK